MSVQGFNKMLFITIKYEPIVRFIVEVFSSIFEEKKWFVKNE
jgi:hypothetical protein